MEELKKRGIDRQLPQIIEAAENKPAISVAENGNKEKIDLVQDAEYNEARVDGEKEHRREISDEPKLTRRRLRSQVGI